MLSYRTRQVVFYALLIAVLPVAYLLVPSAVHERAPELADFAMLASAVLALSYTLFCLHKPGYDRRYLVCLGLGLGCWIAGMTYAVARSGTDENLISTYVLFVSYGAPLLYAAVTTPDEPSSHGRRAVDGVLLILLVVLCYLGVRDLTDANGFLKPEDMAWVVVAFDIENIFLFGTFLVRYLTATDERDHRFFGIGTVFLLLYAICVGIHNHDEIYPDTLSLQRLADILPTVPFMALLCLLHANETPKAFEPIRHRWARQLSVSLAPGMLLAAIFALSLGITERQGMFGRSVLAMAMLAYVVRVTQTQFWFARTRDRLAEALSTVERVSLLDELTGIPNRRAFDQTLEERTKEAAREGRPLSVLMIDIDHFKTFNDTLGHPEGDVALRSVARLLAGALRRPADFIARYGGEEFVVILPGTELEGAQVVARRMNRAVYDAQLEHSNGIDRRVTVSIGVATRSPDHVQGVVMHADRALYSAKHAGRNRFVAATTD
ncbi:MAG TPA: GGDEF domain-containing protein [Luteibacter sp.]|uniref:GGDEF domain-containing protein n=1 Tax=Luteibacter sp. TaxID=1886636 RepID=UPI002CEBCDD2|nr:GGDEF domain-containing protein [Luteibacter sp.]HVI54953.1 GGDEF domain-containing protein [Luteibacter sp.]